MDTIQQPMGRRPLLTKLLCAALLAGGVSTTLAADKRTWQIREFTRVELVPREAGAEPNEHPASLSADALRDQLAQVRFVAPNGSQPLLAADELADLAGPLSQALQRAAPTDDVLLLSSARREKGLLGAPTAVTARLFVQGGQLQLIVQDARFEFFDAYRGTNIAPRFRFGSRSAAGAVKLEGTNALNRRPDWLSIAAQASVQPAAAQVKSLERGSAKDPANSQGQVQNQGLIQEKAQDKTQEKGQDIERRLETLKRLRDKNLISEDEYQQKRKDLLQQL
jgi:hypothetical protein